MKTERAEIVQAAPIAPPQNAVDLIAQAMRDPQFDAGKLQVLVSVKQQWEADEARKAFARDFAGFASEAPVIAPLDKGAKANYAKLDRIHRETRPLKTKYGLSLAWTATKISDDGKFCHMEGLLVHRQGHSVPVSMVMPIPGEIRNASGASVINEAQRFGGAITYCQRRGECAVFNLVTGQDDDGACGDVSGHATADAVAKLRELIKRKGRDEARGCAAMGIARLEEATAQQVADATRQLEKLPDAKIDPTQIGRAHV